MRRQQLGKLRVIPFRSTSIVMFDRLETRDDLLEMQLNNLCGTETRLVKALPKMGSQTNVGCLHQGFLSTMKFRDAARYRVPGEPGGGYPVAATVGQEAAH